MLIDRRKKSSEDNLFILPPRSEARLETEAGKEKRRRQSIFRNLATEERKLVRVRAAFEPSLVLEKETTGT